MNKLFLYLIDFYQKYISILSHGSCRYHPTCSEYSKTQFIYNNFFSAFYFSIVRILSCNKLFRGGFDYPKERYKLNNVIFIENETGYIMFFDYKKIHNFINNYDKYVGIIK